MKPLIIIFLGMLLFTGCEKKNTVEVIPDYNSLYLSAENVDEQPRLIDGNENKLNQEIKNEMIKNSEEKVHLEYKLLLDENGKVEKILTVAAPGNEYSTLVASVTGGWKFEPAVKNGERVKSQYKLELNIPPEKEIDASDYEIKADTMPLPAGGMKALQQNIVYPEKAKINGTEGKVIVQAYINETGDVVKTEVLKSAGEDLDEAAIKALKSTKFTPGKKDGKAVKVRVVIPIVFRLS